MTELQSILLLTGILTILASTVLYWPLEWMNDWLEGSDLLGGGNVVTAMIHRFRHWIRNDASRQWKYRGACMAVGFAYLAIALMLA
jgi:hypothetical protein